MDTSWFSLAAGGGLVVAFLLFRRAGQISGDRARQLLAEGGLLIDVRSPGEFASAHLPGAINLPVGELKPKAEALMKKEQPLVLYCASGTRSAIARSQLKRLGYTTVFNLGAMSRW